MQKFWRNLARWSVYFVGASFLGHWVEIVGQVIYALATGEKMHGGIMASFLEPYPVYGFAIVGAVILLPKLVRRTERANWAYFVKTYLILTGVCAVAEYLAGWWSVLQFGHNPYWDYSALPLNVQGQIWPPLTLLFGLVATVFMLVVYPLTEKALDRIAAAKVRGKSGRLLYSAALLAWLMYWICARVF
ncbi:MAG: putative ABC transporter permease [Candidatus Nomurabacteria bacterium]|jgi:uncharacterized membrane protein|nr:putative ABC transporter permease [Candidatus Nomurabacteria bacterium]